MLIPKPFVFENTINGSVTKVYLPGQETEIHNKKYTCVCVHLCEKFATYPTLRFGVRCIPENATCKFGGRCHGARILQNGKPINIGVDLDYTYVLHKELNKTR